MTPPQAESQEKPQAEPQKTFDNPTFNNASRVIEKMLSGQPFEHAGEMHFIKPEVAISTGLEWQHVNGYDADKRQDEYIRIHVRNGEIEEHPAESRDFIKKVIASIPAVAEHVAVECEGKHASRVKDQLAQLIDADAKIDRRVLEWKGFDPELAEKDKGTHWGRNDGHALKVSRSEGGVRIVITLEKSEQDKNSAVTEEGAVSDNIRNRISEIKETVAKRLQKYLAGENAENIKAQLERMEFDIHTERGNDNSDVVINLRSPDQQQAFLADKKLTDTEITALRESNILTRQDQGISDEQLGKALGRAILHSSDKAMAIFPIIAGREDMKRLVEKGLKKFKEAHPDKADQATALVNDDIFKEHGWDSKEVFKHPIVINKGAAKPGESYAPGEVTVDLYVPKGKGWEILKSIAAMDPTLAAAPKANEQQFATVDSVELVGVHSPDPHMQILLNQQVASLAGKPIAAGEQQSVKMENFATRLIALIEEAHQTVREGMSFGAAAKQAETAQPNTQPAVPDREKAPDPNVYLSSLLSNITPQQAPAAGCGCSA